MNTAGNGIKYRSGSQKWAMVAILGGMVACCAATGRLPWSDQDQADMEEIYAARDAARDAAARRCIFDPVKAKDYKRASDVIDGRKFQMEILDTVTEKDWLSYLKFAEDDGETALHLAAKAAVHDENNAALSVLVKLVEVINAVDCCHLLAKEDAKGRSAIDYISESSDARFKGIWDKYMESQFNKANEAYAMMPKAKPGMREDLSNESCNSPGRGKNFEDEARKEAAWRKAGMITREKWEKRFG